MKQEFVHLHVHSEYSILDGIIRLEELVRRTAEYLMPAVALTDHGGMYGAMEFVELCRQAGIKPIVGCEVYVTDSIEEKNSIGAQTSSHLVLLCKNETGYRNLLRLVTTSYKEGFHYRPRVDRKLLEKHHEGLIALTACLKGEIPRKLLMGKRDEAVRLAGWFRETFGEENFYIELQDHGIGEETRAIPMLLQLAHKLGIDIVATNDAHYLDRDDARYQDVMLCIQTGKKLSDVDRLQFEGIDLYFKTPAEMARLFEETPEAISNTLKIAEMVDFQPEFGVFDFPHFPLPKGKSEDEHLASLALKGLKRRFEKGKVPDNYRARLNYELSVIADMGFSPIFLIVQDCVRHAKENGIPVGPGRGSAVSGLVSWALAITEVDPVKYGLLFERFLNPARKNLPDIDIDFCPRRRMELMGYLQEKYGADHICQIITFNRLKARAAVRDTARVLDIPLSEADRVAKLVPFNTDLRAAIEMSPDLAREYEEDVRLQEWFEYAFAIEGLTRNISVHPAGLVISGSPVYERVPLQTVETTDQMVAQYSMDYIDKLGLIKVDILGLRTLTYIDDTCKLIKARHGVDIDVNKIPLDDKKSFNLLGRGDTLGVFQMEGGGMKELLMDIRPDRIDDIIACIALYRPGPMGSGLHTKYAKRKNGQEPITYDHPLQKEVLESTYGVLTYQEQVGLLLQKMAGLDIADAVIVIKAISKKRSREEIKEHRDDFINGAKSNGVPEDIAENIFAQVEEFAGYGFNKAHSAAYGLIAYQTAYLKANYPIEFYAAYLSSEMHDADKICQIIGEMQAAGIELIPPDVNASGAYFTIEGKKVRFALGAIKNVGVSAIDLVAKAREEGGAFHSLFDFTARVDSTAVNRQVIESLVLSGAMDSLEGTRGEKLASVDRAMEYGRSKQEDARRGQTDLFAAGTDLAAGEPELSTDGVEIPKKQLLKREKELIGIYLSENPLKEVADRLEKVSKIRIADIDEKFEGKKVTVGGMLASLSRRISKRLQSYAIIEVEDLTGRIEGIIFPNTYEECKEYLIEDSIVVVEGRIQAEEREATGPGGEMARQYQLRLLIGALKPFDAAVKKPKPAAQPASGEALASTIEMADDVPKARQTMSFRARQGEIMVDIDLDEAGSEGLARILDFLRHRSGPMRVRFAVKRGTAQAAVDLGGDLTVELDTRGKRELENMEGVREVQWGGMHPS